MPEEWSDSVRGQADRSRMNSWEAWDQVSVLNLCSKAISCMYITWKRKLGLFFDPVVELMNSGAVGHPSLSPRTSQWSQKVPGQNNLPWVVSPCHWRLYPYFLKFCTGGLSGSGWEGEYKWRQELSQPWGLNLQITIPGIYSLKVYMHVHSPQTPSPTQAAWPLSRVPGAIQQVLVAIHLKYCLPCWLRQ